MSWILFAVRVASRLGVITALWGWFAVPLGLPALSLAHVTGLWLLVLQAHPGRYAALKKLAAQVQAGIKPDPEPDWLPAVASVLLDVCALGAGWLAARSGL